MKKLKEDLFKFRYVIIGVMAYLIFMYVVFSELCPIKAIFGIDCPGCGLTRAGFSLITGNIKAAISYNYSIFFWFSLFILFFIDRYVKKMNKYIVPIFFAITVIVTLVRYILIIK